MKFAWVSAVLLSLVLCSATAHALSKAEEDALNVAFQNGYVACLEMDADEFQKIKADPELTKQKVQEAAQSYLARIRKMNEQKKKEDASTSAGQ